MTRGAGVAQMGRRGSLRRSLGEIPAISTRGYRSTSMPSTAVMGNLYTARCQGSQGAHIILMDDC